MTDVVTSDGVMRITRTDDDKAAPVTTITDKGIEIVYSRYMEYLEDKVRVLEYELDDLKCLAILMHEALRRRDSASADSYNDWMRRHGMDVDE